MTYTDNIPEDLNLLLVSTLSDYNYTMFKLLYDVLVTIDEDDNLINLLTEYTNNMNYQSHPSTDILNIIINYCSLLLKEYGLYFNLEDINIRLITDVFLTLKNISIYNETDTTYILNIISDEYTDNETKLAKLVDYYTDTNPFEILDSLEDTVDNLFKPFITKLEYLIEINQPNYVIQEDTLTMRFLQPNIDGLFSYYDYTKTLYSVIIDLLLNDKLTIVANEIYVYFKHTEEYLNKNDRLIFVDDTIYNDLLELDIDTNTIDTITSKIKQLIIKDNNS